MRNVFKNAAPGALAVAFAVHVGMTQYLTGRVDAAGLTLALAFATLFAGVFVAGKPIAAVRSLEPRARVLAAAGGLLAFAAAPGIVAAVRLTDAPAGSVVVFWIGGGWAALAALAAAGMSARLRSSVSALWSVVGAGLVLAGCAAVVASWERPSSFSPLERFPLQEIAILAAGLLFVSGGVMVARAARSSGLGGPLVCGGAAATAAAGLWLAGTGIDRGFGSIGELPIQVVLAASAWAVVCVMWAQLLREDGIARPAALLAASPLLLTALVLVEQVVGVAGPQPMIFSGVLAGSLVLAAGMLALHEAGRPQAVVWHDGRSAWFAALPPVLALLALWMPSIIANAQVSGVQGSFSGSWTLSGFESIAAWSALALSLVLIPSVSSERPWLPGGAALLACCALPWLAATPTHVLNGWLAPGIQQYYGTEYGTITFTAVANPLMIAAAVAAGAGLVTLALARAGILPARRTAGTR